jgi:hypothetical protein
MSGKNFQFVFLIAACFLLILLNRVHPLSSEQNEVCSIELETLLTLDNLHYALPGLCVCLKLCYVQAPEETKKLRKVMSNYVCVKCSRRVEFSFSW